MRVLFIWALALGLVLAAAAQENLLHLAHGVAAVKITDPPRQAQAFAPLLSTLDSVLGAEPGEEPGALWRGISRLRAMAADLAAIPGVNARGDFWLVTLPPAPEVEAALRAMMERDADAQALHETLALCRPTYLLVPLADAAAFTAHRATPAGQKMDEALPGTVLGNHLLTLLGGIPGKPYTDIRFDLALHTTRDIAIVSPDGLMSLPLNEMDALFPAPFHKARKEATANVRRVELGLAMQGTELHVESFTVPVADSPLAARLRRPAPARRAMECAGLLPDNLAYFAAGDALLPGMPGLGYFALHAAFGSLGLALPPARARALAEALDALSAHCSHGRAIGITTPPPGGRGRPTLVAVYHLPDAPGAGKALEKAVNEMHEALVAAMGDAAKMTVQPDRSIDGVAIDVVKYHLTLPGMLPGGNAAPMSVVIDLRFAIIGDKMLMTADLQESKEMEAEERTRRLGLDDAPAPRGQELAQMVTRMREKRPGFTQGARFRALARAMPEGARGIECVATRELAHALAAILPQPDVRAGVQQTLRLMPPQMTAVTMYQEARADCVHGETVVPQEQLHFLATVLNALREPEKAR